MPEIFTCNLSANGKSFFANVCHPIANDCQFSTQLEVSSKDTLRYIFTSRSARTAGTKIALRFPRLFVCLFVCLFVRPHLSRAQYITSYVTMQLQCIAAFGGLRAKLQQMKVVLCCLDGENVVGSRKEPVLVTYSY